VPKKREISEIRQQLTLAPTLTFNSDYAAVFALAISPWRRILEYENHPDVLTNLREAFPGTAEGPEREDALEALVNEVSDLRKPMDAITLSAFSAVLKALFRALEEDDFSKHENSRERPETRQNQQEPIMIVIDAMFIVDTANELMATAQSALSGLSREI
jgi:hypothetical protein